MSTIILFYSRTGHTRRVAESVAREHLYALIEVKDARARGGLATFVEGSLKAVRGQAWPIKALTTNLNNYDNIILMSPVWAGNPPPAIYAVISLLPPGKMVDITMTSGSGSAKCKEKLASMIDAKGCKLGEFNVIKY